MKSLNEASIVCKECKQEAKKSYVHKQGFKLRSWECPSCQEQWIHPLDVEEYKKFKNMCNKTYSVKLRLVGNSYAVSIPREIIDYQQDAFQEIDNIIRMSLESPEKLSLFFSKKMGEDLLKR